MKLPEGWKDWDRSISLVEHPENEMAKEERLKCNLMREMAEALELCIDKSTRTVEEFNRERQKR